jgi:hypothetical protein
MQQKRSFFLLNEQPLLKEKSSPSLKKIGEPFY